MHDFRVLLLYPNLQLVNLLPSNIAVLAAVLKEAGFQVKLFDTTLYKTQEKSVDEVRVENLQLRPFNLEDKGVRYKDGDVFEDFQAMVEDFRPHVIALTATDDTYFLGLDLLRTVTDQGVHKIAGGVYPTFAPEEVIAQDCIDSICVGEGEGALVDLCKALMRGEDITGIENLWVKTKEGMVKNPMRPLVDLDTLPIEDFSVFEEVRFFRPMQGKIYRMAPVNFDRGCPFLCSFCAAPQQARMYRELGEGRYFRVKSIERVMRELHHFVDTYKADYIYFNSETFLARKDGFFQEFAKRYQEEIALPFWCQTRIETITDEAISALEAMNCDRISVGIEQGNEAFRTKFLKKTFTNEQVLEAFEVLARHSIPVTVNNIIGFPDETRELAMDTIRLNRRIKADSINAFYFVPYSGTPLRDYCIEQGYIEPSDRSNSLMLNSILTMPEPKLSKEAIAGLVRTFPLYIKMPEEYFPRIERAERFDAEGNKAFKELAALYYERYF